MRPMSSNGPSGDTIGTTPRATRRPADAVAPAHWDNPPVPKPEAVPFVPQGTADRPDPVRYGDWEKKGIAIDF